MKNIVTRFRAYQLGTPGSSFSYFAGGHFTVLEGRLTDVSEPSLIQEMRFCDAQTADTLHITSWDSDHCCATELEALLYLTTPTRIECPGYEPHSDNGDDCLRMIQEYRLRRTNSNRVVRINDITPAYISNLAMAEDLAFRPIYFNPLAIDDQCANDNSTVKFFRSGSFNVLSLGDVESHEISARLRRSKHLRLETDVIILAHHGADNGFTNKKFLNHLEPQLAICSADYDNQYDHPREEIRELLHKQGVRLMTTKTGDVAVVSTGSHTGQFRAINLKANSSEISSQCDFVSRKSKLLSYNADTVRQIYSRHASHPR